MLYCSGFALPQVILSRTNKDYKQLRLIKDSFKLLLRRNFDQVLQEYMYVAIVMQNVIATQNVITFDVKCNNF